MSRIFASWNHRSEEERDPTRQAPAGGLASCASDLGQFLITLLDTELSAYPPTHPAEADLEGGHHYSLGWNVRNSGQPTVSFSHSGAFRLGAGTCVRFDPLSGFGVAVLSNGEPTGVPEALVTLFFNEPGARCHTVATTRGCSPFSGR